ILRPPRPRVRDPERVERVERRLEGNRPPQQLARLRVLSGLAEIRAELDLGAGRGAAGAERRAQRADRAGQIAAPPHAASGAPPRRRRRDAAARVRRLLSAARPPAGAHGGAFPARRFGFVAAGVAPFGGGGPVPTAGRAGPPGTPPRFARRGPGAGGGKFREP